VLLHSPCAQSFPARWRSSNSTAPRLSVASHPQFAASVWLSVDPRYHAKDSEDSSVPCIAYPMLDGTLNWEMLALCVVELRLVCCRSSPRCVCSSSPKFGPASSTRFGGARRTLHKYFCLAARTSPMSWSSMPRNHPHVVVLTNTVSHYHPIFTVGSVVVGMS
jgi:hypothetical protein